MSTMVFDISGPDPEPQGFMIQYVNQNVVELYSVDLKNLRKEIITKYSFAVKLKRLSFFISKVMLEKLRFFFKWSDN